MKYLLDTNQVVDNRRVVERIRAIKDEGLALSVISVAELYEGVYRSSDPEAAERVLGDFFSNVSILSVSEEIGKIFGEERAILRRIGLLISDLDLFIAATAIFHDLILLSDDRAFERIESLRLQS